MLPCLCVSPQVFNAPYGLDERRFTLVFPQRNLQTRSVAVLDHPHLEHTQIKQSCSTG